MTETLRAEVTKSVCSTRWRERLLLCDYVLYLFSRLPIIPCAACLVVLVLFSFLEFWGVSRRFVLCFIPVCDEASLELLACTTQEPGTKILYITIVAFAARC